MNNETFYIFSFYRFVKINSLNDVKLKIESYLDNKLIRGTILLANEGINASISGKKKDLEEVLSKIKILLGVRKVSLKVNKNDFLPFNRIKVRLKNEIVSLGKGDFNFTNNKNHVHPSKWNDIISSPNIKLIDTRNNYEIDIGKFKKAINPIANSFREFPKKLADLDINKNDIIALYCTGGIRCEKLSPFLKSKGYKNIYQLDGGILNYLNHYKNNKKKSLWEGECFVFDNRVTVNHELDKGIYEQCYGCRHPITKAEINSKKYKKGVFCPYCYDKRNKIQKNKSETRQKNIDISEAKKKSHTFKKIFSSDID